MSTWLSLMALTTAFVISLLFPDCRYYYSHGQPELCASASSMIQSISSLWHLKPVVLLGAFMTMIILQRRALMNKALEYMSFQQN